MSSLTAARPVATINVGLSLMDALDRAERLAYANRGDTAVIYRTARPVDPAVLSGTVGPWLYTVCLSSEAAPDGAEVQTTVARRRGGEGGTYDVIEQIVANLPDGVRLGHRAVIEFFPPSSTLDVVTTRRDIYAYQFMSTEGRNVATWTPSLSMKGVDAAQMQMGFDGRGRLWKNGSIEGEATADFGWAVERAEAKLTPASDGAASVERAR